MKIQNLVTNKFYVLSLENFESFVSDRTYTAQFTVTHIFSENPLTINFNM